jgi:ferredoxin
MILTYDKLDKALHALIKEYRVCAPVGTGERHSFAYIKEGSAINLDGNPFLPPKDFLFPRSETLYGLDIKSGDVSTPDYTGGPGKTLLFGVRPCDVRAISNLDDAFLEKGYTDAAYAARRADLTIVALACTEIPYATCFCDSMGLSPITAEGADVLLTAGKDGYSAVFATEKGKAVEALLKGLLAGDKGAAADKSAKSEKAGAKAKGTADSGVPVCGLKLEKAAELAANLLAAFEDPKWARFSEACLGCGVCSYICPTCYCFDIDREVHGSDVTAFRCWDSCMFSDNSRMAGGHNPRPTKKERLRNRYLHKLAYFDERYGKTLCVGCGRCLAKCPAGLDITAVIEWGGTK